MTQLVSGREGNRPSTAEAILSPSAPRADHSQSPGPQVSRPTSNFRSDPSLSPCQTSHFSILLKHTKYFPASGPLHWLSSLSCGPVAGSFVPFGSLMSPPQRGRPQPPSPRALYKTHRHRHTPSASLALAAPAHPHVSLSSEHLSPSEMNCVLVLCGPPPPADCELHTGRDLRCPRARSQWA